MTLGELISIARECKGMSLRDLERASEVSHGELSLIETGKVKSPRFWTMVALSRALGITLERMAKTEHLTGETK